MRARIAGLLYLAVCVLGPVRLGYIPSVLFVSGNAALTAHSIATHEALLRIGIFCDLVTATVEIFLVLVLYSLLRGVNRQWAILMLVLGLMDVPLYFMNTLNDVGAMLFARGGDFLAPFDQAQREAMTSLFLTLHQYGTTINDVFWGLWLLPLGVLVYRSAFLPRILGAWLMLNGLAYLAESVSGILLPQYAATVDRVVSPLELGEVAFALWLLVIGAKPRRTGALRQGTSADDGPVLEDDVAAG